MQKTWRVVLLVVTFSAFHVVGQPVRSDLSDQRIRQSVVRRDRGLGERVARLIKGVFGIRTTGDGLTPPLPTTPPRP